MTPLASPLPPQLPLLPPPLLLLLLPPPPLLLLQVLVSRLNCSRCVAGLKGGCIYSNRVTELLVTDSSFTYNWVRLWVERSRGCGFVLKVLGGGGGGGVLADLVKAVLLCSVLHPLCVTVLLDTLCHEPVLHPLLHPLCVTVLCCTLSVSLLATATVAAGGHC
jgi:hypothetical protein